MLDKIKGYRTLIVQGVVIGAGVLTLFGVIPASVAAGITEEAVAQNVDTIIGAVVVVLGIVNAGLRVITTGKVGEK